MFVGSTPSALLFGLRMLGSWAYAPAPSRLCLGLEGGCLHFLQPLPDMRLLCPLWLVVLLQHDHA